MQKFILCALTFAALCLCEWAYAQPPGGGRSHHAAPVMRGQAQPAPMSAPAVSPRHDFGHEPAYRPAPPRHYEPAPPPPRPVSAPAPPPPPRHHKSFLQICLPFLTLGLSK